MSRIRAIDLTVGVSDLSFFGQQK